GRGERAGVADDGEVVRAAQLAVDGRDVVRVVVEGLDQCGPDDGVALARDQEGGTVDVVDVGQRAGLDGQDGVDAGVRADDDGRRAALGVSGGADAGQVDLAVEDARRVGVAPGERVDAGPHGDAEVRHRGVGGRDDEAVAGPLQEQLAVDERGAARAIAPDDHRVPAVAGGDVAGVVEGVDGADLHGGGVGAGCAPVRGGGMGGGRAEGEHEEQGDEQASEQGGLLAGGSPAILVKPGAAVCAHLGQGLTVRFGQCDDPWMSDLHSRMAPRVRELTSEVVARFAAEIPFYRELPSETLNGEVTRSVSAVLAILLRTLRRPGAVGPGDLTRIIEWSARRAEDRLPLEAAVAAYLIGAESWWRALTEVAEPGELAAAGEGLLGYLRTAMPAVALAHQQAQEDIRSEDKRLRRALVGALLSGRPYESLAEAAGVEAGQPYEVVLFDFGQPAPPARL